MRHASFQDDEEDRTNEIRQMCDIYRQAYLTIVAANTARSSDGFWEIRPSQSSATKIPFWSATEELRWVWVLEEGWHEDDSEPINTRCWTLQERLLSHRLVIFASHTIQLQCQHDTVNLGDSLNIPTGFDPWRLPSSLTYPLRQLEAKGLTTEAIIETWKKVITNYSERKIKRVEERLVALSGLAETFNEVLENSYFTGLWSGPTLPSMLLWEACDAYPLKPRIPTYIAPSWSWVSYPTPISYRNSHKLQDMKSFDVEILSSMIQLQNPLLPFGKVSAGKIVLKAHVKLAIFVPPAGLSWRYSIRPEPARPPMPPSGIYPSDFTLPDCMINASFDDQTPDQETDVECLALASRSYDYEGVNYIALDGLLVERTTQIDFPLEYRHIGSFFGVMQEEFAGSERKEITLV
jgi:Heterokaryon incompatibility protein (HET)